MRIPIRAMSDLGAAIRATRRFSHIRIDDLAVTAGVSKKRMSLPDVQNKLLNA